MVCVVEAPPYYLSRDQQGQLRGLSTDLLDRLAALVLDFAGGVPFDSLRFRQEALLVFLHQALRPVLRSSQHRFSLPAGRAELGLILAQFTLGLRTMALGLLQALLDPALPRLEGLQDRRGGGIVPPPPPEGVRGRFPRGLPAGENRLRPWPLFLLRGM